MSDSGPTKQGEERRRDERVKKEIPTVLEYQGECLESCSKDLSKGGLCVRTADEFPATTGDTLGLFMGQHRFTAQVKWVDKLLDISTVGLQWKSRFVNKIKRLWFSAASVGALFYLVFMSFLIFTMFYLAFFK